MTLAQLSSLISCYPSTCMLCFSHVEFPEQFLELVILFPTSLSARGMFPFHMKPPFHPQFPNYLHLLTLKLVLGVPFPRKSQSDLDAAPLCHSTYHAVAIASLFCLPSALRFWKRLPCLTRHSLNDYWINQWMNVWISQLTALFIYSKPFGR